MAAPLFFVLFSKKVSKLTNIISFCHYLTNIPLFVELKAWEFQKRNIKFLHIPYYKKIFLKIF